TITQSCSWLSPRYARRAGSSASSRRSSWVSSIRSTTPSSPSCTACLRSSLYLPDGDARSGHPSHPPRSEPTMLEVATEPSPRGGVGQHVRPTFGQSAASGVEPLLCRWVARLEDQRWRSLERPPSAILP